MALTKKTNSRFLPLIFLRDNVLFPHSETIISLGRPVTIAALAAAFNNNKEVVIVSQKNPNTNHPKINDIYTIGTRTAIHQTIKADRDVHVLVQGLSRVKIIGLIKQKNYWLAEIVDLPEITDQSPEIQAICKHLTTQFKKIVSMGRAVDFTFFKKLIEKTDPLELADAMAMIIDAKTNEKQQLLETLKLKDRLSLLSNLVTREIDLLELEQKAVSESRKKYTKSMKQEVLREKMKQIQKELGEIEDSDPEINEFSKKLKTIKFPREVKKKVKKEINRLQRLHQYSPERGYIISWLEAIFDFPFDKSSRNNVSLSSAKKTLNEDHFALDDVKKRMLEYLAVMQLKKKKQSSSPTILCFVGPPGVGKTSIGRSIAKALNRKFVKISLGGIRDEAEIRGHRRTYVGAMPGRIVQGIINANSNNPVFMLDEIDKVGADFRGDPSSALLEALDPEQNHTFEDHYFGLPVDLSKTLFITTANVLDTIPPALQDRLEVIRFSGYTEKEKLKIAKKHLLKKVLKANALKKTQFILNDEILAQVINGYTREAGVRNLERELSKLARKTAYKIANRKAKQVKITPHLLSSHLGPRPFIHAYANERDDTGMATGLAWTQAGGDILFIETTVIPGSSNLTLTGQLGEVMQESCQAALSYVRSRWQELGVPKNFYKTIDVHIHVPEGAVPKDGPSAGIAITLSLISALTGKATDKKIGVTGEITLRGRILEIGGVKEKVIAGHRAGLKKIILPLKNKRQLKEIPIEVRKDIKIHFASHMDQVVKLVLQK